MNADSTTSINNCRNNPTIRPVDDDDDEDDEKKSSTTIQQSPKATKKSGLNYGGIKARFEEAQKNATLLSVTTVPLITHPCLVLSERQTVFNGSFGGRFVSRS